MLIFLSAIALAAPYDVPDRSCIIFDAPRVELYPGIDYSVLEPVSRVVPEPVPLVLDPEPVVTPAPVAARVHRPTVEAEAAVVVESLTRES